MMTTMMRMVIIFGVLTGNAVASSVKTPKTIFRIISYHFENIPAEPERENTKAFHAVPQWLRSKVAFLSPMSSPAAKTDEVSLLHEINQTFQKRNYSFDVLQGIQEGFAAEVLSAMFNDISYDYTTVDAIHLTVKSLLLDMLTNSFAVVYPMVNERAHSNASPLQSKQGELNKARIGIIMLRCVVIPMLSHGVAHTLPTAAMHMIIEDVREYLGLVFGFF
jgi:hypothetical protein